MEKNKRNEYTNKSLLSANIWYGTKILYILYIHKTFATAQEHIGNFFIYIHKMLIFFWFMHDSHIVI